MTKSEIFKTAHKLAKTFEGDYQACFALALKMVYRLAKGEVKYTLEVAGGSRKHKSWVAKVTGEDAKWGFAREFVRAADYGVYELEDGVYNFNDAGNGYGQQFIVVKNGEATKIEKREVLNFI